VKLSLRLSNIVIDLLKAFKLLNELFKLHKNSFLNENFKHFRFNPDVGVFL